MLCPLSGLGSTLLEESGPARTHTPQLRRVHRQQSPCAYRQASCSKLTYPASIPIREQPFLDRHPVCMLCWERVLDPYHLHTHRQHEGCGHTYPDRLPVLGLPSPHRCHQSGGPV